MLLGLYPLLLLNEWPVLCSPPIEPYLASSNLTLGLCKEFLRGGRAMAEPLSRRIRSQIETRFKGCWFIQ
jgi:hypothetical protein